MTTRIHSLLFKGAMIRSIEWGFKTMTRRVPTLHNTLIDGRQCGKRSMICGVRGDVFWAGLDFGSAWIDPGPSPAGNEGPYLKVPYMPEGTVHRLYPKWQPGDLAWTRETWADVNSEEGPALAYQADGEVVSWHDFSLTFGEDFGAGPSMDYESYPGDYIMWCTDLLEGAPDHRWKPSIHMPRWASRHTLTITQSTPERIQDISEEDAKREGMVALSKDGSLYKYGIPDRDGLPGNDDDGWHWKDWNADPRVAFHRLWDSINPDHQVADNGWTWAVGFNVRKTNINHIVNRLQA